MNSPVYKLLCFVRHPALKPVRRLLGLAKPSYQIWTDASGQGYGGHLGPAKQPIAVFQHKRLHALTLPKPLQYHSIKLDRSKIELHEAAALFLCIEQWRRFLHGSDIQAYMDNQAVCDIFSGKTNGQKETIAVIDAIRDLAKSEDIGLNIQWTRREKNLLADGLSKFARSGDPRLTPSAQRLLGMGKAKDSESAIETGKAKASEAATVVKKMMSATDPVAPS